MKLLIASALLLSLQALAAPKSCDLKYSKGELNSRAKSILAQKGYRLRQIPNFDESLLMFQDDEASDASYRKMEALQDHAFSINFDRGVKAGTKLAAAFCMSWNESDASYRQTVRLVHRAQGYESSVEVAQTSSNWIYCSASSDADNLIRTQEAVNRAIRALPSCQASQAKLQKLNSLIH